jgi:AbrB family looped-hinge helix DNA binding protein
LEYRKERNVTNYKEEKLNMQKESKITSRGRVTVPAEIRRTLGVHAGDRILFECDGEGVRLRPVRKESVFAKYAGIGTPGIGSGRKAISRWLREMRGHID